MNTRTETRKMPLYIKGGKMTITGIKPERKKRTLYIERTIDEYGDGWHWFIEEYYNNIIVDGNRGYITRNNGDFAALYDDINRYADAAMWEIEDAEKGGTEALRAYFESSAAVKITPYITGQFKKIMRTAKNDDDMIARLMSLFTPLHL